MKKVNTVLLSCIIFLGISSKTFVQNYFKVQAESDKYLNQRIIHFPNGDLLIGDSSVEALRTGNGGKIYLTRTDPCGNVIWSKAFERREEYLELKDFQLNEKQEIFAYGSGYLGLDELIFLLKLDGNGNVIDFRFFAPETVDHFTYNIQLKNGRLMAYGLILDFNTKKFGFVAIFDERLNFQWGVKFTPFESSGEAIMTKDLGFLCRSGPYLFKLDQDGGLEWANTLTHNSLNSPIAGPLEVTDGFILEAFGEGFGFFYKVDLSGNPVWKSRRFPSKPFPAAMSLLADGTIHATYPYLESGSHHLGNLELSPDGQIIRQQKLETGLSLKPGRIFQSFSPENTLVIAGNPDPFSPEQVEAPGFLTQTRWPPATDKCFSWEEAGTTLPNEVPMDFSPLDTIIYSTGMELYSNPMLISSAFASPLSEACLEEPPPSLIRIDTTLDCGEDWTVTLPSQDFTWTDIASNTPRTISTPDTYQARNQDCDALTIYEYTLEKPSCKCDVFLPSAFSPNQDGTNDLLEFYAGCEIFKLEMSVFNRWGQLIFISITTDNFWDGQQSGRPAPSGVYLALIEYQWIDNEGDMKNETLYQTVTLIR